MAIQFITYRPNINRSKPDVLDRYDEFLSWKDEGRIEGWSARKTFRPGDLAVFYMGGIVSAIVGLGLVDSEPYYEEVNDPADFKNPVSCDFRPVWFLDTPAPMKEIIARYNLHDWWRTCPFQSIRRVDLRIGEALIRGVLDVNPELRKKLEATGWNYMSPDFNELYARASQPVKKPQKGRWELEDLLNLSWAHFELLVGEVFRLQNTRSKVEITPKSGDYGVDIVITSGWLSKKEIVQCKRYQPRIKVSTPDMLMFLGAMTKFKAGRGYFVTTSSFSRFAVNTAKGMNVEMIDGPGLLKMIAQVKDFPSPAEFARQHVIA